MPAVEEDIELVARFLDGDEAAFETICHQYGQLVFSVAWRSIGDRDLAEEAAQATFATAAQKLATLREPAKLRAWLCAICRTEVSHVLRSVVRDRRRKERLAQLRPIDAEPTDPNYARELLVLARNGLSAQDQELLGLVLTDLSGEELADALGIDVGAADTRKSRLYDRLRGALEAYWVTRPTRPNCPELDRLLATRTETSLSRVLCRAIQRHCRSCQLCDEQRLRFDPLALLAGVPVPVLGEPLLRALGRVGEVRSNRMAFQRDHPRWRADGFPKRSHLVARPVAVAGTTLVGVAVVVGASIAIASALSGHPLALSHRSTTTLTTTAPTTSQGAPSSSAPTTTLSTTSAASIPASIHTAQSKKANGKSNGVKKSKHPPKGSTATTTATTTTSAIAITPVAARLVLATSSIDLGTSQTSATIDFSDPGSTLSWAASINVAWLTLSPSSGTISSAADGAIVLTMTRSSAPSGVLGATVTLTASSNTITVPVAATELDPPTVISVSSPSTISEAAGCVGTFTASISAPAGVASVLLTLDVPGASAPTTYPMALAGQSYVASVGPFAPSVSGQAAWSISVTDGDGKTNAPPSTGSVFVSGRGCSG